MKIITLIDPSINSFNLGDQIVSNSINEILSKQFPNDFFITVPAYGHRDSRIDEIVSKSDLIIFCGTAPICSDITFRWPLKSSQYKQKVVLMGVGINSYGVAIKKEASDIYQTNLSREYLHGLRDDYSCDVFIQSGLGNCINIGCPTFWNIKSKEINDTKTDDVLLTLNSSRRDVETDTKLLSILRHNYKKVFFYAQCPNDFDYLKQLNFKADYIIPSNISAIQKKLSTHIDYVGHRLHGGIFALQNYQRAFIIKVDNRAAELQRDFNLPVYTNLTIEEAINSNYEINMKLPYTNIYRWLEQFL